ncbi:MAG TPA: DnaJ domain-containing protein [Methylobacterium sp.]
MTLLLGFAALVALWWLGRNASRLNPALTARLMKRLGTYAALGLALLFALRGRIDLALLFGIGGLWLLDGMIGLTARLRGLFGRAGPAPTEYRSATIALSVGPDGRVVAGTALVAPFAGRSLFALPPDALRHLLAICRASDPDGTRLLELYLDGRHPGWRVDAERDSDARARRPPNPGAMTQEEAYEILGLQGGATLEQIRAAHRSLMKQLHPDQGGTVERAARVNAARDRLTDRHR